MTRTTSLRTLAQRWLSALVLSLALVTVASAQETIRITGRVVSKSDKEPLIGVNITDAHVKRAYAATDVDGRFAFNVHLGTTLKFSMVGAKSVNVKVKNHKFMEVEMEEENISLGEVVVAAKNHQGQDNARAHRYRGEGQLLPRENPRESASRDVLARHTTRGAAHPQRRYPR